MHSLLSFLRNNRPATCQGFEYVIDWMNEFSVERKEVEAAMARAEEVAIEEGNPGEFTNYSFRRRQDIPGLQCADFISWIAYRYADYVFYEKPMHEFAEDGWEFFGGPLESRGFLGAIAITREHLKNWFDQVNADPANLDKYQILLRRLVASFVASAIR